MKIAVIGGGSSYTPELLDGLCRRASGLGLAEVSLHDVDAGRLEVVAGFARRMTAAQGAPFSITATTDLPAAVSGAEYVIAQIRVGGNAARREDERLGRRHGLLGQETTGVGGFAKALRTIPAMLEICRVIEAESPAALLINFTNPSGLVTEAILKHTKVRTIGLCNIPITFHLEVAKALGVSREEVELDYMGLNHLSWVRKVSLRGEDVTAQVLALEGPTKLRELDYPPSFLQALGMIPMHYLRYYYLTDRMLSEQAAKPKTRAEEVMEIEAELMKIYADPQAREKPELLSRRGGAHYSQAALELIEAWHFDRGEIQILNVQNRGAIRELPDDVVIETPCGVNRSGARPLPLKAPEAAIIGLIRTVKAYEKLTIHAAVKQDYALALLALVAHPLGPDVDHASAVLDDIMSTHQITFKKDRQ